MRELPEKETLTVEFKSDIKRGTEGYSDDELVDEIVGMANTAGGFLYLGVEDDGTVTGLIPKHKDAIGAAAMIANKTVPSLSVRTEVLEVADKEILSIEVPESRVIVASISGKKLRRKLKADGTPENIPMYPYEITSRLSDLSLLDFSAQPMMDASIDDIDPNQMVRLREAIQNNNGDRALLELTDEEIEKALHFVVEKDNKLVPTVTGVVVVGRESSIRKLMPTVRADFQVLQGTEVMINQSYTKPVAEMAELSLVPEKKYCYSATDSLSSFFRVSGYSIPNALYASFIFWFGSVVTITSS
jgi:ATP-dependent DNA helicase RecG